MQESVNARCTVTTHTIGKHMATIGIRKEPDGMQCLRTALGGLQSYYYAYVCLVLVVCILMLCMVLQHNSGSCIHNTSNERGTERHTESVRAR